MKNLILFLLSVLVFTNCKNQAKEPNGKVDYTVISGTISNLKGNSIALAEYMGKNFDIKVKPDGTFRDTLRIKEGAFMISDRNNNMISIPTEAGTNLNIIYDAKDLSTLLFSGKGNKAARHFRTRDSILFSELKEIGKDATIYSDFNKYKTAYQGLKQKLLNNLKANTKISEETRTISQKHIESFYLNTIHNFSLMGKENAKVEAYIKEFNSIFDPNDEIAYKKSPFYKVTYINYINSKPKEIAEKEGVTEDKAFFKVINTIKNQYVKDEMLYMNASSSMAKSDDIKSYYEAYMKAATNADYKEEITKTYNRFYAMAKGQPSPKFEAYEGIDGKQYSLDDFKGKYVYIDVWATWCAPCTKEIPFLEKVEKQYHDKNIVFISLSVDKQNDKDKWKKMIADKQMKGIQLLADKDFKSNFIKDYIITTIPRFILLDPKGNIINSNAPRPSSPKLIELFNQNNI